MTICTEAFIGLAREESKNLGMPDLPLAIIKHPIGGESLAVIHQRAEDALPQVIRALTGESATRSASAASSAGAAVNERFTFADEDEALETFHARRLTDGLPVVLPTAERVQAMIAGSGRRAGEVIAVVPPRWAEATVENIAVNAVMAGCRPQYMPVLIAALQAAADPAFGLYSVQATTHPCAVMMLVSGPIAQELGLNFRHGAFGPGFPGERVDRAGDAARTHERRRRHSGRGRSGHARLAGQVQLLRRRERGGHAVGAVPGDARIRQER